MKTGTLFVNPFYPRYDGPITDNRLPPLELINCATLLREAGHAAAIVDAHIMNWTAEKAAMRAPDVDPAYVVVGTSPLNTWQCPPRTIEPFFETARALRAKFPGAFLIGTGPGSVLSLEGMLEVCDLVIGGQPEPFFQNVKERYERESLLSAPGAIYKNGSGVIVRVPPLRAVDMTRWPAPDYGLVPYRRYRFSVMDDWVVELETSRGCPQFCDFCFQAMTHYKYGHKTVRQVVDELRYVSRVLGGGDVFFADLDMGSSEPFLNELLDAMIVENIPVRWSCNLRTSCFSEALLTKMARARCKAVLIGVESADEEFQREMRKNKSIEELRRRARLAQRCGLEVAGYFMIGLPGETEADVLETMRLAEELELDYASFQILAPYSREESPFAAHGKEATAAAVSPRRLVELQAKAYRRFYLRPSYLLKKLPLLAHPANLFSNLNVFLNAVGR